MKFTCDSCGAQYLIADEKIGPRGVKVRCKKCSHVIILRPEEDADAEMAEAPKAANGEARGPMLGGSASSVPVAPSVAGAQPSGLPDHLVAATSSDLGLSQEFRALGFDEPDGPAPRAATLSVGLDLDGAPGHSPDPSPFSSERAGGSLDLVQPEPNVEASAEATAVQARPTQPFDQEETEMIGEDEEAATASNGASAADLAASLGLGVSAPPESEGEGDDEASTRVESLADLAASEAATGADDGVHVDEDETQAAESPFGSEAWAGEATRDAIAPAVTTTPSEDDEVENMRAGLSDALSGLADDEGDDLGAGLGDEPQATEVGGSPSGGHALAALAAAVAEDDDAQDDDIAEDDSQGALGEAPVAAAGGSDGIGTGLIVAQPGEGPFLDDPGMNIPPPEDDSIAQEIGSAFEAMFGGEDLEDDLAKLQHALGSEETNKAETRVFDTEAMAKVEAEQDRAAADSEPPGPEAKEWYVAIEEEQVGPLSESEVKAHWDDGKLQPESLCWRAGMGDWMPIAETEPLAKFVPPPVEPRVPTVIGEDQPLGLLASEEGTADEPPEASAPPKIEPQPEPEAAPRAASEPAWRPSAASALASLAAEELSAPDPAPVAPAAPLGASPLGAAPAVGDVAGASALPASDALEKLLEGEPDKSAASQFGAAEQSESAVRPLPRRADTVSSLPLRDPTVDNKKPAWIMPAAIIGAAVILGLFALVGIMLSKEDPKPEPVRTEMAAVTPPPASAGVVDPPPSSVDEAAAAKKAEDEAAAKKAEEEAAAAKKAEEEAKAAAEAEATKKAEDEAAAEKKSRRKRRRKSRSRSREPATSEAVVAAKPAPAPEPVRAPPARRAGTVEDDLLGAAKPSPRRRAAPEPEPSLPDQLDDADVLSVLRSKRGDVRRCLEKQASADPSLEGTMTVELVIRRSGRPKGVGVREDKFKRSAVGTCMVAAVKRWRFPKFSGAAMPLDFPVRVRAR